MANAPSARIEMYFHCRGCMRIEERNGRKISVDHGEKLAVGWTVEGFQVVCENCGKNVLDFDFLGQQGTFYIEGRPYLEELTDGKTRSEKRDIQEKNQP